MDIIVNKYDALVVGFGAAGLKTALQLKKNGVKNVTIVTENRMAGTSRNTGSDKQTYYKLSLSGDDPDSVRSMAEDLFSGGCVDGDQALLEAALSVRGFFALVEAGVPFPCNEFSEYMGYKTDHDRGRRATSAGPYTSRYMTEQLEKAVEAEGITVLDRYQVVRVLTEKDSVTGLLCLVTCAGVQAAAEAQPDPVSPEHADFHYEILLSNHIVMATGGPAGMYRDSVYPASQHGSSGLIFETGAKGKNLTEWQFGLASKSPRWNVSGTYMQVLPRFVSTAQDGSDAREFLQEYFENAGTLLSMVFLKGYQWPFDVSKVANGSSVIDLLVYRETILRGRRVFLDYRTNPCGGEILYEKLSPEAHEYLKNAGAMFGTPIDRLEKMNAPAISFYLDHHVDLRTEMLEVAVCAQHNNGGIATDANWETDVRGLYVVGEACGSHGVTRPGGSALNAGQVGAIRAAEKIGRDVAAQVKASGKEDVGEKAAGTGAGGIDTKDDTAIGLCGESIHRAEDRINLVTRIHGLRSAKELLLEAAKRMSAAGGMIREEARIKTALAETEELLKNFEYIVRPESGTDVKYVYRLYDTLLSQRMYLTAMAAYMAGGGKSRGSALYTDPEGALASDKLPELYRMQLDQGAHSGEVQEVKMTGKDIEVTTRPVRTIPDAGLFFETEWAKFRERNGIS